MPLGKIVYVCDDVLEDPGSRKLHVIGACDTITIPPGANFPYRLGQLCVFAQFAGGLGVGPVEVRAVDAATGDEVFASRVHQVTFGGGHSVLTVLIRMLDCPFPQPGIYLVQLHCLGTFVDDRRLTVR
jgi:hypothetical protein